jgi:alkanesulfonate monooxygenase SsuD/methylene tetrahydromethanopterin reductase-like flavin-dependent oxidoreductase (luciferase family)
VSLLRRKDKESRERLSSEWESCPNYPPPSGAVPTARLGESVNTVLIGCPETIRLRLAAYEEAGVQELLLRFVDGTNLEALRQRVLRLKE